MRNILITAVLLAGAAATPALAQSAGSSTGTVKIQGSVAERCLFTDPSEVIQLGELARGGTDADAGKLNPANVAAGTATLTGWCNNAAATIAVEAFRLEGDAPAGSAAFTNLIDYTATATANEASATDTTTSAGPGISKTVGMFSGSVVVNLSGADAGGKLLVAGDYSGEVKVTLAPKFVPEL